jgi:PAS domain S-box-containing protein
MDETTPPARSFLAFLESRRDALLAAILPEIQRIRMYQGMTTEHTRAISTRVMESHFVGIDDPEAMVTWALQQIDPSNVTRRSIGAPEITFDDLLATINVYKRHYLESGLDALISGVPDAARSIVRLLQAMDLFAERVAQLSVKREREQASRLRMFERVVEKARDGITITDMSYRIAYINEAGGEINGMPPEQLIGMPADTRADKEYLAMKAPEITASMAASGSWRGPIKVRRPDGEMRLVDVLAFLIPSEGEESTKVVNISRDITEVEADREKWRVLQEERNALHEQVIEAQARALRALGTPLIPLVRGVLALPLIGTIDASRAEQIMEASLRGIAQHKASRLIIDITGVPVVDHAAADALIRTARAARQRGAPVMRTGINPAIAQTLIQLGSDLGDITTFSTIEEAIARVLR